MTSRYTTTERRNIHRAGYSVYAQQRRDPASATPYGTFDILEFAEAPRADITRALGLAITEAQAVGGGRVRIPPGAWTVATSTPFHIGYRSTITPGLSFCSPVTICGHGPFSTTLIGNTGLPNTPLFLLDGNAPQGVTFQLYGGIEDLMLWSGNENSADERGWGVCISGAVSGGSLFQGSSNAWIRGYTVGIVSQTCQNQVFRDTHVQVNNTGIKLIECNNVRLDNFFANQNYDVNVHYLGGPASWCGGLNEGTPSIAGLWCAPSLAGGCAIDVRNVYTEITASYLPFRIDAGPGSTSAGSVRIENININGASSPALTADRAQLFLSNWQAGGPDPLVTCTNGCEISGTGFTENAPGRWNLDLSTRNKSLFTAFGAYSLGLPPTPAALGTTTRAVQDKRFTILTDLASEIAEYWDARLGVALNGDGSVNTWTGQLQGTVLTGATSGSVKPSYGCAVELGGEPAITCSKADTSYIASATLSGGTLLPGTSADFPWILAVVSHNIQSSASDNAPFIRVLDASTDYLELTIKGNGAAADTFVGHYADHATGGADTAAVDTVGQRGHIVESWGTSTTANLRVDLGTTQFGSIGTPVQVGPINRIQIGSDVILGGSTYSDARLALLIVCHVKPSETKIQALWAYLRDRFRTP